MLQNNCDDTPGTVRKKWTIMFYFAIGDAGPVGMQILKQLKAVGSTQYVTFLAHGDPEGVGRPKSYFLQRDTRLDEDIRFRYTYPPHDPAAFKEFLAWGMSRHPAERYMVIIWGHGDGWQSGDIALHVAGTRRWQGPAKAPAPPPPESAPPVPGPSDMVNCQLLRDTLKEVLSDPEVVEQNHDKDKVQIDVLGMDSCLMAMAEVGYQLRDHVKYLIACEEVTPISSWPYEYIFKDLVQYPDQLGPQELAQLVVRKYIIAYKEKQTYVTQSVLNLGEADTLAKGVSALAKALLEAYDFPDLRYAMMTSRSLVQRYLIEEYVDLYDFCQILIQECEHAKGKAPNPPRDVKADAIIDACKQLKETIRGPGGNYKNFNQNCFAPLHGVYGFTLRCSYGTSIYFPCRALRPEYMALDFAEPSGWAAFLAKYAPERPSGTDRTPAVAPNQPMPPGTETTTLSPVHGSTEIGPSLVEAWIFPDDPIFRKVPTGEEP